MIPEPKSSQMMQLRRAEESIYNVGIPNTRVCCWVCQNVGVLPAFELVGQGFLGERLGTKWLHTTWILRWQIPNSAIPLGEGEFSAALRREDAFGLATSGRTGSLSQRERVGVRESRPLNKNVRPDRKASRSPCKKLSCTPYEHSFRNSVDKFANPSAASHL